MPRPLSLSPPATFTPSPPHALQALRQARVWEPPSLGFLSSGHGWGGRGDLRPSHSALSCSCPSSSWLHRPAKLSISPLRPHLPHMSFNSPFRAPKKEEPTCEKTLLCPKDCVRHLCVTSLKSSSGKVRWGPREGKGGGEGRTGRGNGTPSLQTIKRVGNCVQRCGCSLRKLTTVGTLPLD